MYVTKEGNKYRAWESYTVGGKRKKASVTMDKDTRAERKKAQERLRAKIAIPTSEMNYTDLVERYLQYQKVVCKPSTWSRNEATLRRLTDTFDNALLSEMNAGFISSRLMSLTTSPGTFNEYLKRVKAMFRWAYRNDYISSPECVDKIHILKDDRQDRIAEKYLEADELKLIMSEALPYYSAIFEFLALSGLRIGEMIALEDADVTETDIIVKGTWDYRNHVMNTPKTAAGYRYVHIQPELADCIRRIRVMMKERRLIYRLKCPYFVFSILGGRMSYDKTNRAFNALCVRLVGRSLSLHALRHTHVALMAAGGADFNAIARRCGHANSRTTREIYYHVTKQQKAKDDAAFDAISVLNGT